jgi:hypothetical protein
VRWRRGSGARSALGDISENQRNLLRGPDVEDGQAAEFVAAVAVLTNCGLVDGEEALDLPIEDPHGHGVTLEDDPLLVFRSPGSGCNEGDLAGQCGSQAAAQRVAEQKQAGKSSEKREEEFGVRRRGPRRCVTARAGAGEGNAGEYAGSHQASRESCRPEPA